MHGDHGSPARISVVVPVYNSESICAEPVTPLGKILPSQVIKFTLRRINLEAGKRGDRPMAFGDFERFAGELRALCVRAGGRVVGRGEAPADGR